MKKKEQLKFEFEEDDDLIAARGIAKASLFAVVIYLIIFIFVRS